MSNNPHTEVNPVNPYAPPSAAAELYGEAPDSDEFILADRGTRLGASFLDGLVMVPAVIPAFTVGLSGGFSKSASGGIENSLVSSYVLTGLLFLGVLSYQWYLVSTLGQSLGKKWLGIKIVKMNGEPVGFVHGVILRVWMSTALQFIPFIGKIIRMVDVLMIFGKKRRCLHDLIAGTKVVLARSRG